MKSPLTPFAALIGVFISSAPFHACAADPAKPDGKGLLDALKQKMTPKDLTPDETERMLKLQSDIVIIDVRTSEEFSQGHLPRAVNLDFFAPDFSAKIKGYEGKSVLIHCASGGRSGQTVNMIKDSKFQAIYHLKTGFTGWQAAGKQVVR
jgi:rhodanese-related sulfurtransferase